MDGGTYASANFLVTSSLAFPNTLVERQQAWYFGVLLHLDKLLCSAIVFRLLHRARSGRCVLFLSGYVQLQLNSCSGYSHGILVVFVVLLAKCLKWLTNKRTPCALAHAMATHAAFDYELVTWDSSCIGPSALFTFVDFTALFFSRSKMALHLLQIHFAIVSHAKTRVPTCLYCTDIITSRPRTSRAAGWS